MHRGGWYLSLKYGPKRICAEESEIGDALGLWRDRIIKSFEAFGGQISYKALYADLAIELGRSLTSGEMAGVRREIENHSSDSKNWKASRPDLFYTINGLGQGTWGLRSYEKQLDEGLYVEGERLYREMQVLARNRELVARAKGQFGLVCMVCEFDFERFYGALGEAFAECHHLDPLSGRDGKGTPTKITELAIVCANCHRMLHRRVPVLSLAELKAQISNSN